MAIFKCKMCGGALEIEDNKTVVNCEYCGTKQTLPKLSDERKANLYDRANHFRRNNEFDKAMSIYESILNEDKTDAESYWSLVLCRYGIEYVEDPASHKRVPTVNRAQYTSIFMDEDYKSAIEYADGYQKEVYESEAKAIDDIQKGILEISQKEEPFDVFICYKETDANGRRTPDSVLATELYHELVKEGFKVFFSRITLEDKLGTAYEPYIFAALNSAKVMVVLGTKQEYFNAVWVKNEWSRYLALIKNGARKTLIPAYKDMDPYDLPEEFSHLQAQDMTKLGFMQDLVRGIRKIAGETEQTVVKETVVAAASASTNTAPLLERAFMFLEDGDWQSADEYCEKVLDIEPKNSEAYLGKLMAELKARKQDDLKNCALPFESSANYQKVIRFGDETLAEELASYNKFIIDRNEKRRIAEEKRKEAERIAKEKAKKEREFAEIYRQALIRADIMSLHTLKSAILSFEEIIDYKDSEELCEKCREKLYDLACDYLNSSQGENYNLAINAFGFLGDYKDSKAKKAEAHKKIKEHDEKTKALIIKATKIAVPVLIGFIIVCVIISSISKFVKYKNALELAEDGSYATAIINLRELGDYKDAEEQIKAVKQMKKDAEEKAAAEKAAVEAKAEEARKEKAYNEAVATLEKGDKAKAAIMFGKISGYKDAREKSFALWDEIAVRETVSADIFTATGVKSDGTVVSTGEGSTFGEKNVGSWTDIVAISTNSYHTAGLKSDGTVVAVGRTLDGECSVSDWTDIVDVATGDYHTVGLKFDGTVVAVGDNENGQCNVSDWTDIVDVVAGARYTVGLKSDGTVVATEFIDNPYNTLDDYAGQCDVSGWTDIVAVSAGNTHTVGLKADGTVVAVGSNYSGQCKVSDWTDIVAVSAGSHFTVGLKADGTVVAVGDNENGQCNVSDWTDIVAVSTASYYTFGLKSDGTVIAAGDYEDYPLDVSGWKNIKLPGNARGN